MGSLGRTLCDSLPSSRLEMDNSLLELFAAFLIG